MALSKANTDALRKLQERSAVRVMKDAADDGGVPVMTPDRIKRTSYCNDGGEPTAASVVIPTSTTHTPTLCSGVH